MVENGRRPRLVGNFIRERREALGLSQRALGQLFSPTVTTQFISNVERGVTPLPPAHIPTLTKALMVSEEELFALLEQEYTAKISGKLGKEQLPNGHAPSSDPSHPAFASLTLSERDLEFFRSLYEAYRQADKKTKQAFSTVCESILNVPKSSDPVGTPE